MSIADDVADDDAIGSIDEAIDDVPAAPGTT